MGQCKRCGGGDKFCYSWAHARHKSAVPSETITICTLLPLCNDICYGLACSNQEISNSVPVKFWDYIKWYKGVKNQAFWSKMEVQSGLFLYSRIWRDKVCFCAPPGYAPLSSSLYSSPYLSLGHLDPPTLSQHPLYDSHKGQYLTSYKSGWVSVLVLFFPVVINMTEKYF